MSEEKKPRQNESNESDMVDRLVERAAQKGKHGSEKDNMASALKLSYIFIGILVAINLFMAFALLNVYKGRNVSIKIPPAQLSDNTLVFGSNRVSKTVYEIFADYIVRDIGNVNYHNVDEKFDDFLDYTDARKRMKIARALAERASEVKRNMVSQKFQLQKIEITKLKNGYVKAVGIGLAERKVGDTKAFEELPYQLTLYMTTYYGNPIVSAMKSGVYYDPKDIASRRKVEKYEKSNPYIQF